MGARSPSSRAVGEVIRIGPAPMLKARGYRRTARTFFQHEGELYKVVNFQASRWNSPDCAEFTVDLSVVLPFFHEMWTGRTFPRNPGSAAPMVQERIGTLMPTGRDHWWEVRAEVNVSAVAEEVRESLEKYGLPYLDSNASTVALMERLESGLALPGVLPPHPLLCRAILLTYYGCLQEAGEAIRSLAQSNTHEGFGQTIIAIAGRLGLEVAS